MRRKAPFFDAPAPSELVDQNQQGYVSQLAKALQLQGRAPGLLHRNISVGIQLDDYTAPEFWTLRGGTRWSAYRLVGATAGQRGLVQVLGGGGSLGVIEAVAVNNSQATLQTFRYGMVAQETAAGGGNNSVLDDRYYGAAVPSTLITSTTAVAPVAPNSAIVTVPPLSTLLIPMGGGVVVTGKPNSVGVVPVWKIVAETANIGFEVTVFFRERSMLPSEA